LHSIKKSQGPFNLNGDRNVDVKWQLGLRRSAGGESSLAKVPNETILKFEKKSRERMLALAAAAAAFFEKFGKLIFDISADPRTCHC
jgi:hypothetical protein